MDNESTLNSGELMNTDNQLASTLCMPESHNISFGNILNSAKGSISVKLISNLLEGAVFIVSNGSYQHENIPSYWQLPVDSVTSTFDNVANTLNDCPESFFHGLIKAYADLYNIDLHLIIYNNNKYIIIDKKNFDIPNEEPCNREKHAFIWCNADNTLYCPLFINDVNGHILTVFKTDEVFVWQYIESFVNQINQELLNTAQNQTEQYLNLPEDDLSHMAVDHTLSSTNHSAALVARQPEPTSTGRAFIGQILEQIYQLTNPLEPKLNEIILGNEVSDFNIGSLDQISPRALADRINQRLMLISEVVEMAIEQNPQNNNTTISSDIMAEVNNYQGNTVQLNETNNFVQTDQNSTNVQPSIPTHLSNTIQVLQTTAVNTPTQFQYDAPEISIQPKPKWHYRNMKDLGKQEIPLLPGDGPQRTLIQVKVPPRSDQQMFLAVKTQTYNNRDHRSKVLVPEHTKVNMSNFCNDNNLDRLQFDKRNRMDYFDPVNKCVYLAISPTEHVAEKKDVRIRMFNLYQSSTITRDMINSEQLEKCKLAFWLCTLEHGVYRPISTTSLSRLIEEG